MIGFKERYSYDETATRFSERMRANMPMDVILQMEKMEASQLKCWGGKDGKLYAAVYFVRPNMRYIGGRSTDPETGAVHHSPAGPYFFVKDQVIAMDAIEVDRPARDQIDECWENFKKDRPMMWKAMQEGRMIVNLQFER